MSEKPGDILKSMNVPWITKNGCLDLAKFPIDSILKQSLSNKEDDFRSACCLLTSMCSAGRAEAAVFLYGLLILNQNDMAKKELVINALGTVRTAEAATLLFRELNQTESSNSTRRYIDLILRSLYHFPLKLVENGFSALIGDGKWSYRMKRKFEETLDHIRYRD